MVLDLIERRLSESGFSLVVDRALIPSDDESTLFVCSGMQPVKGRFRACDGGRHASLQSCLRMDDLEAVGDGEHLTYFEMVGSFSFAPGEYELAVQLWDAIARELRLPVTHVTVHPERPDHRRMWERCGRRVELDPACVWSDGDVGGHCCEVFCGEVEIGTIVNPMPDLADVGFGWERLHQVLEGRATVFETSLFAQGCSQVVADHLRALERLVENGVHPGNRGRGVCLPQAGAAISQRVERRAPCEPGPRRDPGRGVRAPSPRASAGPPPRIQPAVAAHAGRVVVGHARDPARGARGPETVGLTGPNGRSSAPAVRALSGLSVDGTPPEDARSRASFAR
jgi:tRNA synthetases class II (A)